jgi:hypothetical protein
VAEPDDLHERPARPGYLVAALVVLSGIGMLQALQGWHHIQIVRDPSGAAASWGATGEVAGADVVSAIGRHADVTLPLGVAALLLGSLLVVLAVRGLVGRRVSAGLLLQVVVVDIGLLLGGWVLQAPVRDALIEIAVTASSDPPATGASRTARKATRRAQLHWWFRGMFAAELGVLGLGALAFTRRRAREALAAPEPEPEE